MPTLSPRLARLSWGPLGLIALALAGYLIQHARSLLHPLPAVLAEPEPGCDLRAGACRARFADGATVTLELEPRRIPVLTPLTLRVAIAGLDARQVQVDFTGVDMDMGFNRVDLREGEPGLYLGHATLPVCVRARMDWEARVLILSERGLVAAPFRFATDGR